MHTKKRFFNSRQSIKIIDQWAKKAVYLRDFQLNGGLISFFLSTDNGNEEIERPGMHFSSTLFRRRFLDAPTIYNGLSSNTT